MPIASQVQPAPTDEIIGLLARYAPGRLARLKARHPNSPDIFKVGITAGTAEDEPLILKAEIALEGMQVIMEKSQEELGKLGRRIKLANRFKYGSQVLALFAGSAVVALMKLKAPVATQFSAAIVGVLSSLLAIGSENASKSHFSQKDLRETYVELVKARIMAEQIIDDLTFCIKAKALSRIDSLVRKANVTSAEIKRVVLTV